MMTSRLACWLSSATWQTQSPMDQLVIWPMPKWMDAADPWSHCHNIFPGLASSSWTTSREKKKMKRRGQNGMCPFSWEWCVIPCAESAKSDFFARMDWTWTIESQNNGVQIFPPLHPLWAGVCIFTLHETRSVYNFVQNVHNFTNKILFYRFLMMLNWLMTFSGWQKSSTLI